MNCEAAHTDNSAEKYVLGQLSEAGQTAFEQHFFVCAACLEEVQMLQSIQGASGKVKPAKGRTSHFMYRRAIWAALAASLIAALGLTALLRTNRPNAPAQRAATAPIASASPAVLLLARVDPPQYTPSTLRGPSRQAADQFGTAMKSYAAGDYAAAAQGLKGASAGRADDAGPRFYLGVCDLVTNHTDEAVAELRSVVALGDTPYLEQARFFLAKGLLAKQDVPAASRELELTIQLAGDRAPEARQMLDQLRALPASR